MLWGSLDFSVVVLYVSFGLCVYLGGFGYCLGVCFRAGVYDVILCWLTHRCVVWFMLVLIWMLCIGFDCSALCLW